MQPCLGGFVVGPLVPWLQGAAWMHMPSWSLVPRAPLRWASLGFELASQHDCVCSGAGLLGSGQDCVHPVSKQSLQNLKHLQKPRATVQTHDQILSTRLCNQLGSAPRKLSHVTLCSDKSNSAVSAADARCCQRAQMATTYRTLEKTVSGWHLVGHSPACFMQEATIFLAPSDAFVPPPSTQAEDTTPFKVDATGALVRSGLVFLLPSCCTAYYLSACRTGQHIRPQS